VPLSVMDATASPDQRTLPSTTAIGTGRKCDAMAPLAGALPHRRVAE
jgi:hypothetical protein